MESQLTNNEIAKVFAMYADCKTLVKVKGIQYPLVLCGFNFTNPILFTIDGNDERYKSYTDCKLLLTPLSKITDEHTIEVAKMNKSIFAGMAIPKGSPLEKQAIRYGWKLAVFCHSALIYQYLIQQGYAVPIFFSINHPCNGKTPIELNIAIEAT